VAGYENGFAKEVFEIVIFFKGLSARDLTGMENGGEERTHGQAVGLREMAR